ncbi:MAG TPA: NAD(P)H-hydrate dehydratase [Blastocatellia bacterium]|nr:NAD(P)H-hydrate dehydratase [Blastocatellia bacterium]
MKVLTADQMREVDRLTSARFGVPGLLLMENAAARAVEAVERAFGPASGKRVMILCGRGNNGGDGAAVARQLNTRGALVDCLLLGRVEDARGDARANFEIARALAGSPGLHFRFVEIEESERLAKELSAKSHDCYVDAIFGTGLTRPASGIYEEAIGLLNERAGEAEVISIDIPSGLSSDSSAPIGAAVRARLTVTFTAPKIANILPPASDYNGALVVANIGSPGELIDSAGSRLSLVEPPAITRWLRDSRRRPDANKGDAGKVLIIAGSRGKTGAACLAGAGAMRAGAGLVTVAAPESAQPVLASRLLLECMSEPLAETSGGCVSREALERALELAFARDVVALGPGLGSSDESTRTFVRDLVARRERPMVIDADGLNALAPWGDGLRGSAELPMILTPHPGEMSRLIDRPVEEVVRNRVEAAREFATTRSVVVVLKGSRTVIAGPDGEVYVNTTGNAGMATGGTGDVLTGICAALLAQRSDDPVAAAVSAVYLHGLAGDIAASRAGVRAMIASDITENLGQAFIEAGGDGERP